MSNTASLKRQVWNIKRCLLKVTRHIIIAVPYEIQVDYTKLKQYYSLAYSGKRRLHYALEISHVPGKFDKAHLISSILSLGNYFPPI